MAQGFKIGGSSSKSFTARKNHVNVKKQKTTKKHGLRLGKNSHETKKINKSIEQVIASAANGPNQGPSMAFVRADTSFQAMTIKGTKTKGFLKPVQKQKKK